MIELRRQQIPIVRRQDEIIREFGIALNSSDTGTGKTYMGLASASNLRRRPFVVAPKSALPNFRRAAQDTGTDLIAACNIEMLKTGKTPYLKKTGDKITPYRWCLPDDALLIIDECHRFSGQDTQNGRVLAIIKPQNIPTLLMSATPFDSPLKMRAIGYLLGLHNFSKPSFYRFCRDYGCYHSPWHNGLEFITGEARIDCLQRIYQKIANRMVRLAIADIEDFPKNNVYPELFDLDPKYQREFTRITDEFEDKFLYAQNKLVLMLRLREHTEALKVFLLRDLTLDMLAANQSVAVFVGFRATVAKLKEFFPDASVIIGGQSEEERAKEVEKFQTDKARVCIATIDAGGQSINLHQTTTSRYPRQSLITPNFSAIQVTQALGRICRDGALSPANQRFVLIAGTVEEKIYNALKRKTQNIGTLIDSDLALFA